ncbi:MAG: sigma-70 family RNA polymerase sigma factor [Eubacterium sp.]|nr:sigma-70 family RNA polymerase sigma factor [Eubacterium sp.]
MVIGNEQQIYRIAKSILKRDEDCADAAQEAVAKALAALPSLKNDAYAKTWFIRILIHAAYDILRKQRMYVLDLDEAAFDGAEEEQKDYTELYEAIFSLSEDYRAAIVMHYIEGYRLREIADILEIPEATVKTRLRRGRQALKKLMEGEVR